MQHNSMDNSPDWTEQFIAMVETKPILYDRNVAEYADKDLKNDAWTDVCEVTIENWESLTSEEKALKVNDAKQRWKNLRSCFTRELREQRKRLTGGPGQKKRRKYVYFDQLMFLLPTLEDKASMDDEDDPEPSTSFTQGETRDSGNIDGVGDIKGGFQPYFMYERPHLNTIRPKKKKIVQNCAKDIKEEMDEDKLFLLSLVPPLKRMREDQKYEVKIEFLQIMMNDAKQRWKNLLSRFTRELREQIKRLTGGPGQKKRRKYVYFDQLMFLLTPLDDKTSMDDEDDPEPSTSFTQGETRDSGNLDGAGDIKGDIKELACFEPDQDIPIYKKSNEAKDHIVVPIPSNISRNCVRCYKLEKKERRSRYKCKTCDRHFCFNNDRNCLLLAHPLTLTSM